MSCPDCFTGTIHQGETLGKEIKLHDLDVYVTSPDVEDATGIIVMIPDAFGFKMPNNRLWGDQVAQKWGWTVFLPDCMNAEHSQMVFWYYFSSLSLN